MPVKNKMEFPFLFVQINRQYTICNLFGLNQRQTQFYYYYFVGFGR